jgi:hypothetical protein
MTNGLSFWWFFGDLIVIFSVVELADGIWLFAFVWPWWWWLLCGDLLSGFARIFVGSRRTSRPVFWELCDQKRSQFFFLLIWRGPPRRRPQRTIKKVYLCRHLIHLYRNATRTGMANPWPASLMRPLKLSSAALPLPPQTAKFEKN